MKDLGHADKIIVGKDSSVIVKDTEKRSEIQDRIEELKTQRDNQKLKKDRNFVSERIAFAFRWSRSDICRRQLRY